MGQSGSVTIGFPAEPPASGTLTNARMDTERAHDSGFDPAECVWPSMVTVLLDDAGVVEPDEQRPRIAPDGGAGAHHTDDPVVRARRLR